MKYVFSLKFEDMLPGMFIYDADGKISYVIVSLDTLRGAFTYVRVYRFGSIAGQLDIETAVVHKSVAQIQFCNVYVIQPTQ